MHAEQAPHFYPEPADFARLSSAESADAPHPRLGWVTATHICRRWREVALATPWLWAAVPFCFGQDAAATFLRRAKCMPLLFDVWFARRPRPEYARWTADAVRAHLGRMHTLRVAEDIDACVGAHEWRALAGAAPALRTFWIRNAGTLHEWPARLFGDAAPALRSVWLTGFRNFPWDPAAFRAITTLRVEHCEDEDESDDGEDPDGLVCLEDMLHALARLPALAALTIVDTFPSRTRAASLADIPTASLPALRELRLEGRLDIVAMLVHRLVWPRSARVSLVCAPRIPPDRRDVVLEALRDRLAVDAHLPAAQTLRAVQSVRGARTVELWYDALQLGEPLPALPLPDFRLVVPSPDDEAVGTGGAGLQELLAALPLGGLRVLALETHELADAPVRRGNRAAAEWPVAEPGWRALFADCKHVQRVRCTGRGVAEGLLGALYDDAAPRTREQPSALALLRPASAWAPPERLLFPALSMLYLPGVDWSAVLNVGTERAQGGKRHVPWVRAGVREPVCAAEVLSAVASAREDGETPVAAVVCSDAAVWKEVLQTKCRKLDVFEAEADGDEGEEGKELDLGLDKGPDVYRYGYAW
jgi:hypothetical protein